MRVRIHPVATRHALLVALLLGLMSPARAIAGEEHAVYTLQADGLACPFCAYGIEKQLSRIDGVDAVEIDVKSGTVVMTMQPGATLTEADVERAVEAAGFTLRDFRSQDEQE